MLQSWLLLYNIYGDELREDPQANVPSPAAGDANQAGPCEL